MCFDGSYNMFFILPTIYCGRGFFIKKFTTIRHGGILRYIVLCPLHIVTHRVDHGGFSISFHAYTVKKLKCCNLI